MSGHPLDNYKFELTHYNISPLSDFNTIKAFINSAPNTRSFRLAGLVIDAQHRLTKAGKNFCALHLEDFSGKTEFMIWSEDYVKYEKWLEKGKILLIEGGFKQRFNTGPFEFKIFKLYLLETLKKTQTKQLILEIPPQFINEQFIEFLDINFQKNPGNTTLKINIPDIDNQKILSMNTFNNSFQMNDDMLEFLEHNQQIEVKVDIGS